MRNLNPSGVCCERCPAATPENTRHIARRRLLKAAVFQPQPPGQHVQASHSHLLMVPTVPSAAVPLAADGALAASAATKGEGSPNAQRAQPPPAGDLYRVASGHIIDISPHVVTIGDAAGERRFTLTSDAKAWRGSPLDPSALYPGDEVAIRLLPSLPGVADRIWANIGRVTGTIIEKARDHLVVSEGSARKQQVVVVPAYASRRVEVRFPTLQPGYLLDLIGIRRAGLLEAVVPATSQPTYRVDQMPAAEQRAGRSGDAIVGSATWHDSSDEPFGALGVSYPAVDPASGCVEDDAARSYIDGTQVARELPYLAVGSVVSIYNECADLVATLPVTSCAPTTRLFNDRCVTCKVSPRGRVADLTMASFIALGGELESGCFNAMLTVGR